MPPPASGHDIIVVGASAGGVEALVNLAHGLDADLPATVFVVLHIPAYSHSHLPQILSRSGPLPGSHPCDRERFQRGHIYVAPPDHHLLVERDRVRVVRGPKENGHRPAVDPLFRSAAAAYGPRVIGVVLSGALDDGTAGLRAIKRMGGLTVVQDPTDALVSDMPANALEYIQADDVLPAARIGPLLNRLAREAPPEGEYTVPEDLERETRIAEGDPHVIPSTPPGELTVLACPDCGGPLWELHDGDLVRYRCRNGHGFTPDGLMDGQMSELEDALWLALNTLENSTRLAERMARDARVRGSTLLAQHMEEKSAQTRKRADLLRRTLLASGTTGEGTGEDADAAG